MADYESLEDLRERLLGEVHAGGFSGFPAMLPDEDKIRRANVEELLEIARWYGLR